MWAEIDAAAFAGNLRAIRSHLAANVRSLLVLKADAYGHGARELAPLALREGVDGFGVATVAEALELRAYGIEGRILVLGTTFSGELEAALAADLELVVATSAQLLELVALGKRARIHLHLDTGMHRLGLDPNNASALLRVLAQAPQLAVVGLMTHVASTKGALAPEAREQATRFHAAVRRLAPGLAPGAWLHVANSAGALTGMASGTNAVRIGVAAYGLAPHVDLEAECVGFQPVLTLRARVAQLHRLAAGERVGYDGTWQAQRPSWIATVAAGYADGLPFRLSDRGWALVRGRRAPYVGRVSMDYAALDVTDVGGLSLAEGTPVTLLGRDGDAAIDAWELAHWAGTSPYEIVTSIGRRVPRVLVQHPAPLHEASA